ncbi:MAG: DUF4332 domain-containing protein [Anaerolineae bacterium]|nr:DUF4332 domain-containing protein [Anaerolineae bacterium]
MKIDWNQVKKETLWHYEDLIEKILNVLDYGFVQKHYNHSMDEAAAFSERIRQGYWQNGREVTFIGEITEHFRTLSGLGIRNYQDLIQQIDTRAKCEVFLQKTGFHFEALIQMLNYLFRWVLPFKCPVKELVEADDNDSTAYLETLKKHKIRSNLDVLENCHTRESRASLARETGIAETFILDLAHRADISRLAYVRGKTVKHLCRGGYNTLEKIANADLRQMEIDMTAYYTTIGKSFSDFKAVIPLDWMIGGAKVLPRVIEE